MLVAYREASAKTLSQPRQPRLVETAMNAPMPLIAVKPPPQGVMRWGAVFAGLAVGLGVHLLFSILGAAAGITVPGAESAHAGEMPVSAGTWHIVCALAAAFCGGYVAARTSGLSRVTDGVLYGLVAWGVTTLLFAALASQALVAVAGGLFGQLFGGAEPAVQATVPGASAQEPPRQPGLDMVPRQHWQRYRMIRARSNAIADIERELKLPHERAARIVDDMIAADAPRMLQMQEQRDAELRAPQGAALERAAPLSLPQGPDGRRFLQHSQAEPPAAVDIPPPVTEPAPPPPRAERYPGVPPPLPESTPAGVNLTVWWLFASTAGSLLAAVLGGALGAHGARRRYPRRGMIAPPVV